MRRGIDVERQRGARKIRVSGGRVAGRVDDDSAGLVDDGNQVFDVEAGNAGQVDCADARGTWGERVAGSNEGFHPKIKALAIDCPLVIPPPDAA